MSSVKGTIVSAPIVPTDSRDTYGTHDAKYGIGGFRAVQTIVDRDAIPSARRTPGMRVRVYDDNNGIPSANNTDWEWTGYAWIKTPVITEAEAAIAAAQAAQLAAENARDAANTASKVFTTKQAGVDNTAIDEYFSIVSANNNAILDLYKNVDDTAANALLIRSYPSTELVDKLVHPTARTYYVTMDGDDLNDGTNLKFPLATINKAIELIEIQHDTFISNYLETYPAADPARIQPPSYIVIVHPGTYVVQPDTVIPRNCGLYGYDLRVTNLTLPFVAPPELNQPDLRPRNMFQMTSGCKVRGFTFLGLHQNVPESSTYEYPPLTYDTTQQAIDDENNLKVNDFFYVDGVKYVLHYDYSIDNPRVAHLADYDMPPTKGWAFVFKPGEFITRSPYISDCSQLHDFSYEEMTFPIDRLAGNPIMPRGGGNIWAQGSILDPDSPLKSVVVDSFTAINPNGFGYLISHGAFVQLVSVFTNWSRVGIWADTGGQVTLANSNTTFGDYGFLSTGYSHAIDIPENDPTDLSWPTDVTLIDPDLESVVTVVVDPGEPANLPTISPLLTDPINGTTTFSSVEVNSSITATALPTDVTLVDGGNLTTASSTAINSMWDDLILTAEYTAAVSGFTGDFETLTKRDARVLVNAIQRDIQQGSDISTSFFIQNLFDWQGVSYFRNSSVKAAVLKSWDILKPKLTALYSGGAVTFINSIFTKAAAIVNTPASYLVAQEDNLTTDAKQLIDDMWVNLYSSSAGTVYDAAITGYNETAIERFQNLTKRDAGTLLRTLQADVSTATYTETNIFIQNLFQSDGESYLSDQVLDATYNCWNYIHDNLSTVYSGSALTFTQALVTHIITVVSNINDYKTSYTSSNRNTLTPAANDLIEAMWSDLTGTNSDVYEAAVAGYNIDQLNNFKDLTFRDAATFLRAIQNDIKSGQDRAINFFIKGLFDWKADLYLSTNAIITAVTTTWTFLSNELTTNSALYGPGSPLLDDNDVRTLITGLIAKAIDVVSNSQNYKVVYPSTVEATGQQLSYSGTGVNYNALPFSQRGTGLPPNPRETIVKKNGGRIFATYATQAGDTYLGDDLRVDFERNTIEGQAFSRGVQNITLPLIIGIGA